MKHFKAIYTRDGSDKRLYSKWVQAATRAAAVKAVRDYAGIPAGYIKSCRVAEKRW